MCSSRELAYLFQPIVFETLGPLNASAIDFVESIGRRFRVLFDDSRETCFLLSTFICASSVSILY
jgi:hypothetical protein